MKMVTNRSIKNIIKHHLIHVNWPYSKLFTNGVIELRGKKMSRPGSIHCSLSLLIDEWFSILFSYVLPDLMLIQLSEVLPK